LDSFKIEQTHFVSSLNKTLESLEESPLSTKELSQVKYLKEKFKKVKGAMKRKIFIQQTPVVATVQVNVK
jgi:predicted adenine nucleotide alpha hydrolase (AANH) superfamily ATPase